VPEIPEAEQTPLVRGLVGIIEEQAEQLRQQEELIGRLKDEITVLKGRRNVRDSKPAGWRRKRAKRRRRVRLGLRNGRGRRSARRPS
jgi:hypothetical protein